MKNKNVYYVIIAVIAVLLILFTVFKIFTQNSFTYNGRSGTYQFTMSKVGTVKVYNPHVFVGGNEYIYAYRNKPQDLESIPIEGNLEPILKRPTLTTVYVTRDLNLSALTGDSASIAIAPLDYVLNSKRQTALYPLYFKRSFAQYDPQDTTKLYVDCDNANYGKGKEKYLVIYMTLGEENKVYTNGACIVVEGKDTEGLIKSSEKLGYYLLGVF